jgi:ferredoxin
VIQFDQLCQRADALGLAVRGAFHPGPEELDPTPAAMKVATIVLLGFTGSLQWAMFRDSPEAADGLPHPLDRWSRRVVSTLAGELGALEFYPSGTPAAPLPFQRLAFRSEPVHQSPIGLLIHSTWGLWHAYRGALGLPDRIELPRVPPSAHPCSRCQAKPCLSSCPVNAFRPSSFDLNACVNHVLSEAGSDCRENGCRARRACPVGPEFRYVADQARFHMHAFLRAVAP